MKNIGLVEVGKAILSFANLYGVVFFINNYLQKDSFSILGIILSIYTFVMLYYIGYNLINIGEKNA